MNMFAWSGEIRRNVVEGDNLGGGYKVGCSGEGHMCGQDIRAQYACDN